MSSGGFSLDDSAIRLRSDAHIDPLMAVQYDSVRTLCRDVIRLYRNHFGTLTAIYLLPAVPFVAAGAVLRSFTSGVPVDAAVAALSFLGGLISFAAVAVAVSDICSGNRPGVRRSYRRICAVRRFSVVVVNTLLYYVVLLLVAVLVLPGAFFLPYLVVWAALMVHVAVRYMFVPVISAIEPRPRFGRTFARSAWLGSGHRARAAGMLICTALPGFLLGLLLRVADEHLGLPDVLTAFIAGPLTFPPLYIGAVLQYYDLRARKEAFRLVELPEDIV